MELMLSALECTDWQGKAVADGVDFYPKENDPCLHCRCEKGYSTMCKTVSCAPPNCPNWKAIAGFCCRFECLDKNGVATKPENSTGPPSHNGDVSGTPTDNTVTDLGLRLVASTVTTFLILALLLFLIHRFRQRRLLMTLRRYSRRREQLDDLDSISYSPDFYHVQCPPYEDPPPPYTPPKPLPGEQPPPYELIDGNPGEQGNEGQQGSDITSPNFDQNCNNVLNGNNAGRDINIEGISHAANGSNSSSAGNNGNIGNSSGRINANSNVITNGNNSAGINGCVRIQNDVSHLTRDNDCRIENSSLQQRSRNMQTLEPSNVENRNLTSVHFKNNPIGQSSITMGVQNRNRNNRNRYSDGNFNLSPSRNVSNRNMPVAFNENTAALNLELQNTVRNFRNRNIQMTNSNRHSVPNTGDISSSTTDIGESTTSAESLSSSPESPHFDAEPRNLDRLAGDILADDANSTVKRFLDRQFGPVPKNRRYPTTMSQSWTSAQVSPPGQSFRQSISLGSFPPKPESQTVQKSSSMMSAANVGGQNLSRSKSEHLKTNGSLINQPYKGVTKSPSRNMPHAGHAVRVAYKEADELCRKHLHKRNSCDSNFRSTNSSQDDAIDSNASVHSGQVGTESSRLTAAILDPGDIIVTRRQDELRKLRLSHLLNKQTFSLDSTSVDCSNHTCNPRQLQRSLSENSVNSMSVCSETGEKNGADVAISNDAPYPTNSYKNFLQSCLINRSDSADGTPSQQLPSNKHLPLNQPLPPDQQLPLRQNNIEARDQAAYSSTGEISSCKSTPKKDSAKMETRRKLPDISMMHSWHGGQMDSCDDNVSVGRFSMNTLGRNVDRNFEKKTYLDKDVSNMFFPYYKPSNSVVEIDKNCVPSSEMRACASQLYNYETEELQGKKDKKKNLFKRHSAGCMPMPVPEPKTHSPRAIQKQYQRLKSSKTHDRQHVQRVSENSAKDHSRKRVSSRERKSSKKLLHFGWENSPKVTDLTPPHLLQSHVATERPTSLNIYRNEHTERPDLINTRSSGKSERKRSKSLGRGDMVNSASRSSSQGSQSRKKKRQSIPAQDPFHQELEHVLHQQKSPVKSTMSQSRCQPNGLDRNRAITQV
ncbi:probable WRKY transcription factor protein 1 isoform X2 [Mercenaria mercenaria]|uniref:probable WRKY transcription factor protein 1 isoform X2 n=1 Tax=Mercenaria mercenaria TaxID=6596 RepID=UPI00234E9CE6|nr:probable WRKY transcription factor protein 1 isoform X2 [Mercenaria mercenaria]